jgi:hypothetical protein
VKARPQNQSRSVSSARTPPVPTALRVSSDADDRCTRESLALLDVLKGPRVSRAVWFAASSSRRKNCSLEDAVDHLLRIDGFQHAPVNAGAGGGDEAQMIYDGASLSVRMNHHREVAVAQRAAAAALVQAALAA